MLTFRAVAHERSFSRAAETLALSQPSVSNQVALLEREIGRQALLERAPGGLRLTRWRARYCSNTPTPSPSASRWPRRATRRRRPGRARASADGSVPHRASRVRPRRDRPRTLRVTRYGGSRSTRERTTCRRACESGELHLAIAFQDTARPRQEPRGSGTPRPLSGALHGGARPRPQPGQAPPRSGWPTSARTTGPSRHPTG